MKKIEKKIGSCNECDEEDRVDEWRGVAVQDKPVSCAGEGRSLVPAAGAWREVTAVTGSKAVTHTAAGPSQRSPPSGKQQHKTQSQRARQTRRLQWHGEPHKQAQHGQTS